MYRDVFDGKGMLKPSSEIRIGNDPSGNDILSKFTQEKYIRPYFEAKG